MWPLLFAAVLSGEPAPLTDRDGDPLPPGAVARCGSTRLRLSDLVRGIAFSPGAKRLAVSCNDGGLFLFDAATGDRRLLLRAPAGWDNGLAFAPDGKSLAVVGGADAVEYARFDADSGQKLVHFRLDGSGAVRHAAISPDGRTFAVGRPDATLRLYDADTGRERLRVAVNAPFATGFDFAPDGRTVAVAGGADTVRLFDADTGRERSALRRKGPPFTDVRFAPDGRSLAAACSGDESQTVWDLATGKERFRLGGKGGPGLFGAAFAPDGGRLAVGARDPGALVVDAATGRELLRLRTPGWGVRVAFSPDGHTLAAADNTESVSLWDLRTGRPVASAGPAFEGLRFAGDRRLI